MVAGCTVAGTGVGVSVGVGEGSLIVRGGIATPAASSTGPAASGVGVGVGVPPGGSVKSCTRCCAKAGGLISAIASREGIRAIAGFIAIKSVKRVRR